MSGKSNYVTEIAFVGNLRSLVSAYEEIAVMRIDRVRQVVEAARNFREGLSGVMTEVRKVHSQQVAHILRQQKKTFTYRQAALLLSTNARLGGRITGETARAFATYIKENKEADVVILGQVGKEHFTALMPGKEYTFFSLHEENLTPADLKPLLEHLLQYEAVTIFFPSFQNLIKQLANHVNLGESRLFEEETSKVPLLKKVAVPPYIFEPALEKLIDFFNTQLFVILLHQIWSESWLSLLGSRITAMEQATTNIDIRLKKLSWEKRREERRIINKKQRDRLSGISLWNK